jgi:hypothetical protein
MMDVEGEQANELSPRVSKSTTKLSGKMDELQSKVNENLPQAVAYLYCIQHL